jgi:hypothetical protein
MEVGEAILAVGVGERPASFDQFSAAIEPAWVSIALSTTGKASVRRRKLPAEYVVWLVIGMGLFRDRAIAQVVDHLNLVLPGPNGARGHVTNGAIVRARNTLGPAPLAALFRQTATVWTAAAAAATRWRGLAIYGLDGTTLHVPDTAENVAGFGRPGSRHGEGAGYPQLRLVALSVLRHHVLAAAAFGPYRTSEQTLAAQLWTQLPDHSLVILDRGFGAYALLDVLTDPGRARHWLLRVKRGQTGLQWAVRRRLGPGDALVVLRPSRATRRAHPTLREPPCVRAIRVHHRGFRPYVVLTSLCDPTAYPAVELRALYHERWELELSFAEIKTHTLERVEALRSTVPARVEQEVWGLLLAYNLVRLAMSRAAPRAGLSPLRLSYRHAVLLMRSFWHTAWLSPPGTLPRHLDQLLEQLALLVIPERRARRYPRAVKIKMSNYPRKRPRRRWRGVK